MIKLWVFLISALISGLACAKSTCADIHGQQSYPPLTVSGGKICFVQEAVLDPKTAAPIGAYATSLYYVSDGGAPKKAEGRGLLYDDTPGKIVDAFPLAHSCENQEKVAVIHSVRIRESLVEPVSSGNFYSVSVFDLRGNTLRLDARASEWFGADYSWISDGRRIIYEFPYKSKKSIQQAINSSFAGLINTDELIPASLKNKSYLFEDPNIKSKTKKYLIGADSVTVDKATAGWCQVSYAGGAKPIRMWLMCDALNAAK